MTKIYNFCKDKFNLPTLLLIIGGIIVLLNCFSYLIPFTDNAFVVANSRPVAADVSGHITHLYVANGQKVNQGDPLFKIFDTPYQLALLKSRADYEEALTTVDVYRQETQKNQDTLENAVINLNKMQYEYSLKSNRLVSRSVSQLDISRLKYDIQGLVAQVHSLKKQLAISEKQILQQQKKAASLKAQMDSAAVNVDLTTVTAGEAGIVDNMYLAVGTPVTQQLPLFSLISTNNWYVQANFEETDLRNVRPGDKAIIILRMYSLTKVFHGVIVNNVWASDRQAVSNRTQQQIVGSDNEWLNLPQRFPLQIKILDPDPKYPLNPGASAYVYIKT